MDLSRNARSLEDFQKDAAPFLERLAKPGALVVLTIEGKPALVVQSAASYRALIERAERLETIESVKEGLAAVEQNKGRGLAEAFHDIEGEVRRTAPEPS